MKTISINDLLSAAVGFETHLRDVERRARACATYPPYNIEKIGDVEYAIHLAIAGFKPSEIDITVEKESLIIKGTKEINEDKPVRTMIHSGIAERNFIKPFTLTKDIIVKDGATFNNGILTIMMEKVTPEEDKPVKITIK